MESTGKDMIFSITNQTEKDKQDIFFSQIRKLKVDLKGDY